MTLQWRLEWQQLYVEALLETNVVKLRGRVASAEKAVLSRVAELCASTDGQGEWQAIEDAISGLLVLKREIYKSSIGIRKDRRPDIVKPRMSAS
jgi:hypothetical protein